MGVTHLPNTFELSKGCCKGCPFKDGMTEEATLIQNYGCLPDKFDIVTNFLELSQVWACHSKPEKVCTGVINYCKDKGIKIPAQPTAGETFGQWGNSK